MLIVYGFTTGNTEMVAERIGAGLNTLGNAVTIKNVTDAGVEELGEGYDLTLLGVSTWGDEDVEFQEDFEPFYEELDSAQLKGCKVGLFGCGDSSYEHFCGAVNLLEKKMEELGAFVVNEPLRIDGDPGVVSKNIDDWVRDIGKSL